MKVTHLIPGLPNDLGGGEAASPTKGQRQTDRDDRVANGLEQDGGDGERHVDDECGSEEQGVCVVPNMLGVLYAPGSRRASRWAMVRRVDDLISGRSAGRWAPGPSIVNADLGPFWISKREVGRSDC